MVIGKVKLVLKNLNKKKVKSMAYVVKGGKECLLRRRDGEVLDVIIINLNGAGQRGLLTLRCLLREEKRQP